MVDQAAQSPDLPLRYARTTVGPRDNASYPRVEFPRRHSRHQETPYRCGWPLRDLCGSLICVASKLHEEAFVIERQERSPEYDRRFLFTISLP